MKSKSNQTIIRSDGWNRNLKEINNFFLYLFPHEQNKIYGSSLEAPSKSF